MIIQCSECQARFKLADEKIKAEGTKVRCSKCRHIFTVYPPESEETSMPAETEESFTASPPEPEQPSGPKLDIDFSAFETSDDEDAEGTDAGTPASSFDEFSFGEETEDEKDEVPFSFGDTEDTSRDDDDQDDTTEPSAENDGEEDDFFGSLTDESALSEKDSAEDFDFGTEATEDDFGFTDASPSETEDFFATDADEKPGEIASPFEDSFSETRDDDFSWDETPAESGPSDFEFEESATTPSLNQPFEEEGLADNSTTESSFLFGEPESAEETATAVPTPRATPEKSPAKGSQKADKARKKSGGKSRKSPWRGLILFVLVLLLGLSAAGGYLFYKQGNLDISTILTQLTGQPPQAQPAGQIQITDLTSAFVSNREAGELFVIHGQAVNQFKEVRSAIAVKGVLYNPNGKALLQQTVFCGNRLTTTELQEWPFDKIEEAMNNQFGDSLSNLNVAPGARIPFTIVFKNLPSDLSEFTVEMADSKPGSKQ
ncbi:DUF3426 domain-containing protein [Desulfuromonas sp. AOP6]|uniref:DUF3426 domain-containing protein n=1 Tax=Desulfuromonas sp. AOP6 TaxID=1566351 RepID=UPI0012778937|nr:DUF3426 domain-containing protein [Desulfuromonas sp. AOP6]BCA78972.1 hypothetical protein AOP6_0759 [Desulfuromonas sp. AOP6]